MRRIFALPAVIALLIFSNVAAADVDWNSAPHFDNQRDLVNYLNRCKNNLNTTVPVVLTNGFIPTVNDIVTARAFFWIQTVDYGGDGQNTKMLYEITNYPGERVAYAYLHNDTSFLNAEELQLYNIAVKIVDAAKYNSPDSNLRQELYIHDAITARATYYNENPIPKEARFKTAIGALIDGKANCQGYSDAFYMLGRMCGFNVDKVNGYGNDASHTWNTINFGDEKNYFVDVTFDDASFIYGDNGEYNGYIYFNAPTDVMTTHRWFDDYVPPNLQEYPDERYFFYTEEFKASNGKYFGTHATGAESALQQIAYNIAQRGWRFSYVAAPYNETYTDSNYSLNRLLQDILPKYGWRGNVTLNVMWRGKYMFFTADAKAR